MKKLLLVTALLTTSLVSIAGGFKNLQEAEVSGYLLGFCSTKIGVETEGERRFDKIISKLAKTSIITSDIAVLEQPDSLEWGVFDKAKFTGYTDYHDGVQSFTFTQCLEFAQQLPEVK